MKNFYSPMPAKKPVNLTINVELLQQARELKLSLSAILESALAEAIREGKANRWLRANRETIRSYNDHVATEGAHGDVLRRF
jgi:antitoxin CcdA